MKINCLYKKLFSSSGFTLAETLITLVIVGVIAAITVPNMIAKYREHQTVVALKKFYSEISQAYLASVVKDGPIETWDVGNWDSPSAAVSIMNKLAPSLRIIKNCGAGGSKNDCFPPGKYKSLNPSVIWNVGITNPSSNTAYSTAKLESGASIFIHSEAKCNQVAGSTKALSSVCASIGVDINGSKGPNAFGRDSFYFRMTKYGIVPIGTKNETSYNNLSTYCNRKGTNVRNGYSCTAWIIEKGNMDYLHRDVSW